MSFEDDLNRFSERVEAKTADVFVGIVDLCHESIQIGSAVTGAPGQPVDTGALRASWQKYFISPTEAQISTNLPYAESIEDGVSYAHDRKPLQQHSIVGGFHSVKLTRFAFQRIVNYVNARLGK